MKNPRGKDRTLCDKCTWGHCNAICSNHENNGNELIVTHWGQLPVWSIAWLCPECGQEHLTYSGCKGENGTMMYCDNAKKYCKLE